MVDWACKTKSSINQSNMCMASPRQRSLCAYEKWARKIKTEKILSAINNALYHPFTTNYKAFARLSNNNNNNNKKTTTTTYKWTNTLSLFCSEICIWGAKDLVLIYYYNRWTSDSQQTFHVNSLDQ